MYYRKRDLSISVHEGMGAWQIMQGRATVSSAGVKYTLSKAMNLTLKAKTKDAMNDAKFKALQWLYRYLGCLLIIANRQYRVAQKTTSFFSL